MLAFTLTSVNGTGPARILQFEVSADEALSRISEGVVRPSALETRIITSSWGVGMNAVRSGYAVVDFETTGFRGLTTDRVVEIGVVCLDCSGEVADEWTTLVNPERDVSASHIHGITGRDVYGAPRFADVAGVLADSLRGRVLVAHNLSFEAQFLMGEFARLGHDLQLDRTSGICTMTLASTYLPQSPRNLGACCSWCGLEIGDAHSALADARAATGLLCHYMAADERFDDHWSEWLAASLSLAWPVLPADRGRVLPRGAQEPDRANESYVGKLAARLSACGGSGATDSYLDVLDRALIDRVLTLHEIDELIELATSLGLSREQTDAAHDSYVAALARQAWADGVVTQDETDDLVLVGGLFGVGEAAVRAKIEESEGCVANEGGAPAGAFALEPGDRVVFTGEVPGFSRDSLVAEAEALGLVPMSSVSRRTKVVVAADPDSISGKARSARERGVPVITVAAYLRFCEQVKG
jgi:DNA polymerase-3 subunit epsilon